jgi:hypothetical protein
VHFVWSQWHGIEASKIKSYHADNGILTQKNSESIVINNSSIISFFSGVDAKHQNWVAERNIKTIAQWARTNMLHLATHWPQYASLSFWPQAIDYLVWVFNNCQAWKMAYHQMKYGPLQKVILVLHFHKPMFLGVWCTCSMLIFRMGRTYLSESLCTA